MATDPPLNQLVLSAASVADDLGYVALADVAQAAGQDTARYRIIGGHMVTVLAARWMLGADLCRETGDADLGVTPVLARTIHLSDRLMGLAACRPRWLVAVRTGGRPVLLCGRTPGAASASAPVAWPSCGTPAGERMAHELLRRLAYHLH